MTTRLFLPWSLLAGLLAVVVAVDGLKATALVLGKVKPKSTEAPPTDTPLDEVQEGESTEPPVNGSTRSPLTGIPQIDYIHDPNLPRELNGYNLTDYPFYDRVPDELDFKCDGLHDGFYASVPHKCQVYHHCLFGTRYDFLCANYTAFDQKTFICHFVSEVDCENSPKYFKRNEALYKAASSSTTTTTTTTQAPPPPPPPPPPPARRPQGGGRRRPYRRRRPVYEYYYDDEEYDDADYYDDELPVTGKDLAPSGPGRHNRNRPRRPLPSDEPERRPSRTDDLEPAIADERKVEPKSRPSSSVYDRPRVPPKIRRPVPKNERDKYDYNTQPRAQSSTPGSAEDQDYSRPSQQPPPKAAPASKEPDDADYYDDEEEEYLPPARPSTGSSRNRNPDYYPPTAERELRRPSSGGGRNVRRRGPGGRRRYVGQVETATPYSPTSDEDYEDEELPRRPVRPSGAGGRRRVQASYPDAYSPQQAQRPYATQQRSSGSQASRYKYSEEDLIDEDPVPAPRPAYISPSAGGRQNYMSHKRNSQPQQQPEFLYDEYSGTQAKSPPSGPGGYRRQENKKTSSTAAPRAPSGYAADLLDEDYYDDEEAEEEVIPSYNTRSRQPSRDANPPNYSSSSSGEYTGRQPAYNKRPPPQSSRAPVSSLPRSPQVQPGRIPATASQKPDNISPTLPDQSARKNYYEDESSEQTSSSYRPKPKLTYVEDQPVSPQRNISPPSGNPTTVNKNPSTAESERSGSLSNKTDKEAPSGATSRGSSQTYSNFRTKAPFIGPNSRNAEAKYQDNVVTTPKSAGGAPASSQYPSAPEVTGGNKNSANNPRLTGIDNAPLPSSSQQGKGNPGIRIPSKIVIKPIDRDARIQNVLADLNEHDIDVTINDALHPTLHPTRSITSGFVPTTQEETQSGPSTLNKRVAGQRYQAQLPSGPRGSVSYLTSSASQRYITRTPFNINSNERLESGTNIYLPHDQSTGPGGKVEFAVPSERPNNRHRQKEIPIQPVPSGPLDYRSTQTKQQQGPLYSQQRDSSAEYY
ncbi:serine/arginine repetitive matrix protein 1-like [Schistocerca nitens]|uniref:serine/arginine repetitive matrix protein 1-like n=1 Tax=Schistocerca nitens TaxID=7011 RepID=UPI0021191245|nr:serine/arginine repetitive matrix protein 1-like [Schistocerca nitens]